MDWASTLIGAAIAFASSIGIIVVERLFDRSGKLKIYAKVVYHRTIENRTWGFHNGSEGMFFGVPIWIELENSSNTTRVIRDVNLVLYKGKTKVAEMVQINRSGKNDNEYIYANDGSYSFMADPKSIRQYTCYFSLKQENGKDQSFDKIVLRYFNERDNEKLLFLAAVDGDWKTKQFPRSGKWIYLKKKC